jgi:hypothetical protein
MALTTAKSPRLAAFLLLFQPQQLKGPMKFIKQSPLGLFIVLSPLAAEAPVIPVHISIISEKPEAIAAFTEENFQWIINTLNEEFKSGDGEGLARFELRQVTPLAEMKAGDPFFFGLEDHKAFNSRITEVIKLPQFMRDTFNIFIYNNAKGNMLSNGGIYCYRRTISEQRQEDCYARVLLHWKALVKKNRLVLLHESGHAFGLNHVTKASAEKKSPDNNVMAADENPAPKPLPEGEKGYYFTPSQVTIVKRKLETLLKTYARVAAGEPLAEP